MFSKQAVTKSIIKTTKFEKGYIVWSSHHDLPQKRVLFITKDDDRKTTTLKIFSIHDLNTCLVEKTLEEDYDLLNIFPDGSILLNQGRILNDKNLIKLCPESLDILSSQVWKGAYSVGVIDNESFFVIKSTDDKWRTGKLEYFLSVYKWKEDSYVEVSKEQLLNHPLTSGGNMEGIQFLGKNRYCCQMRGHNTAEFRVLIFEIDANNKVKELGVIKPKAQYSGSGSAASGEIIALPNGKLLTYHDCHDNVQIWDTETLSCVNEWNWSDIQTPKEFSVWCLTIIPFPDSINLLVGKGDHFYLFNTDKLVMKQIDLSYEAQHYYGGKPHILPNGQVISFVKHDDKDHKNHIKVASFKLPEIMHYQKMMTNSQLLARLTFRRSGLPYEISDQIISYTLTPDAKEMLARKAADSDPIEDNEKQGRCLCM